ncbi:MAG: type II toxin-antitoxin system death-on-curing family toxin [Gammaproteobacteria bacterium]|nr:type II toxin-antitoxin system death-on-curing family toxin [Gammaproteobacteria bacterium]
MREPNWVLTKIVFSAHQMLLSEHGGGTGIRDKTLLESALARPKQRFEYEPGSTPFELAASYSFGLAKNHPFIDGNKRTSLAIGAIFLEINGIILNAKEPETVVVFEQLASDNISETGLSNWFESNSIPSA